MTDNSSDAVSSEDWEEPFNSVSRHLQTKKELVEEAQELVSRLYRNKQDGGPIQTVTVLDEKDRMIDIRVISNEITPAMVELAEIDEHNDRIEYPFDGDKYYLKKKIRYV